MSRNPDSDALSTSVLLTRRLFVAAMPLALAACSTGPSLNDFGSIFGDDGTFNYASAYGAKPDEKYPVPAMNYRAVDPAVLRRIVQDPTGEEPGTVVVDPGERRLYLVLDGGKAVRYGVGVGREGFEWKGRAKIARRAEWPTWTPPAEMIARDPHAAPFANGMPGGLDNPLGARALYLYNERGDTGYRIHGTNAPRSIGQALSSGCIRMFNQDVIDLYERVPNGAKVIVRGAA